MVLATNISKFFSGNMEVIHFTTHLNVCDHVTLNSKMWAKMRCVSSLQEPEAHPGLVCHTPFPGQGDCGSVWTDKVSASLVPGVTSLCRASCRPTVGKQQGLEADFCVKPLRSGRHFYVSFVCLFIAAKPSIFIPFHPQMNFHLRCACPP